MRSARIRIAIAHGLSAGLLAALVFVYFKRSHLLDAQLSVALRYLPVTEPEWLRMAPLFAADVLEGLLGVGLPVALLAWAWPRRARLFTVLVPLAALLIQIVVWVINDAIGRFANLALVGEWFEALRTAAWAVMPVDSIPTAQWIKFGFLALSMVVAAVLAPLVARHRPLLRLAGGTWLLAAVIALGLVYGVPGLTVWREGMLARAFASAVANPVEAHLQISNREELIGAYRTASESEPQPDIATGFQRPGADRAFRLPPDTPILWVVLETAAERDWSFARRADIMPNIASLRGRAILPKAHFSITDYSIPSDFSLHTSLPDGSADWILMHELPEEPVRMPDALGRLLAARDYRTELYVAGKLMFTSEVRMYLFLGFGEPVQIAEKAEYITRVSPSDRIANEAGMYQRAASDLAEVCAGGAPFFFVVRSMLGHSPVVDPGNPAQPTPDLDVRRSSIMRLIDDGVGQLLTAIEGCGSGAPLIMVTGDHGYRSRGDDPEIHRSILSFDRFQVPFVLHHPSLPGAIEIEAPTSHLDVVPTILDLLDGTEREARLHIGRSMLEPGRRDRPLLLASRLRGQGAVLSGGALTVIDEANHVAFFVERGRKPQPLDYEGADARDARRRFSWLRGSRRALIGYLSGRF